MVWETAPKIRNQCDTKDLIDIRAYRFRRTQESASVPKSYCRCPLEISVLYVVRTECSNTFASAFQLVGAPVGHFGMFCFAPRKHQRKRIVWPVAIARDHTDSVEKKLRQSNCVVNYVSQQTNKPCCAKMNFESALGPLLTDSIYFPCSSNTDSSTKVAVRPLQSKREDPMCTYRPSSHQIGNFGWLSSLWPHTNWCRSIEAPQLFAIRHLNCAQPKLVRFYWFARKKKTTN